MTQLEQLSHDSFYSMQDYSQITIDLIQELEDILGEQESGQNVKEDLGALSYRISTVVEIIDPELGTDVKALLKLIEIIEKRLNK